jgi:tetratricopeptide (TPR) repeat protein
MRRRCPVTGFARDDDRGYVAAGMWDPDAAQRLARAEQLRGEGRYEEAIAVYTEAIARHPALTPYRFVTGELYFELQRYRDAASVFAEIVRAEPHHAQAWGGLGRAAHLLGEDGHALAALEQAILLAPDWAEPLYEAALLYAERGEHAPAEDRLRRALARDGKLVAAAEEEGLLVRYPGARPA